MVATLGENGSLAYDVIQIYQCGVLEADMVETMGRRGFLDDT
ncbi:hypothetical protein [Peribacillus sp. FSL E2-0159]